MSDERAAEPTRRTSLGFGVATAGPSASPPRSRFVKRLVLLLVGIAVVVLGSTSARFVRATALLLRLSGERPAWASAIAKDYGVESVTIPVDVAAAAPATARARIYRPLSGEGRGLVLAHGVHHLGIDEPRLVALARAFAEVGFVVLTPELEPLADYRVDDPGNLATLRAAVRHLSRDPGAARGGVGLLGVSFAGGLSLRVAADGSLAEDLAFVASIGGHHDLRRVARFFVTDRVDAPEGPLDLRAHDYGLAVLVYNAPDRFVDAADAPILRAAVRAFLHESYPQAHQLALRLSDPGRAVFDRIFHRDRLALQGKVLAALPAMAPSMEAASPTGKLATIAVPVFLLHGAHDDVVPEAESRWSAREAVRARSVHVLVTSQIGHAELGRDDARAEQLRLVAFMADLIGR